MKPINSRFSALLCYFFLITSALPAQIYQACGTDAHQAQLQTIPAFRTQEAATRQAYREYVSAPRAATATYVVPTVIHIVQQTTDTLITDARIQGQLDVLNEDFRLLNADTTIIPSIFRPFAADTDIEFRLAQIDPHGCPTNGINRVTSPLALLDWNYGPDLKRATQWNPHKYMNVWVVESINGGNLLGYAINPNYLAIDSSLDGIVVGALFFGKGYTSPITPNQSGRTLTHEVGHYLGLQHTFYGGCGGNSPADCLSAGDEVCDTPPVSAPSIGCTSQPNTCTETPVDLPDMVYNHMDYTDDLCRVMFTEGQADRMHFYLNGIRANLTSQANLTATGCDGTVSSGCTPRAQFVSSSQYPCAGDQVNFYDLSPGVPTSWSWTFSGGIPSTSTLENPITTYPAPGVYSVTLEVTNGFGSSIYTDTTYIHVAAASLPPLTESFEGSGGLPIDWYIFDEDGLRTWQVSSLAASTGSQSMYHPNFGGYYNRSVDDLVSEPIDLSGSGASMLTYDLAYRRYNSFQQDTLMVQLSSDCGQSWNTEWTGTGLDLASVPGILIGSPFVPNSSQWRKDSIDLTAYQGASDLRIRFRAIGNGGQDIYLDNINISGIVSALEDPFGNASHFAVVSPIKEAIELHCQLEQSADLTLTLTDVHGKIILKELVRIDNPGDHRIRFGNEVAAGLAHGIYILRIRAGEKLQMKKLVR